MKKHSQADVLVSFASLRSAYESTVETMQYPQVCLYRKNLENSDIRKIALNIIKFEQGFTTEKCVQKMQSQWQTVLSMIRLVFLEEQ